MKISHEDHGDTSLVAIAGDLLSDDVESYRRCLSDRFESGVRNIVLDMAGLASIDSAGMETLLWTSEEAVKRSGRLKLVATGTTVSEVLRITRLARRFDIANTVEEAARALR
jgi:anti-anti-sigma factor